MLCGAQRCCRCHSRSRELSRRQRNAYTTQVFLCLAFALRCFGCSLRQNATHQRRRSFLLIYISSRGCNVVVCRVLCFAPLVSQPCIYSSRRLCVWSCLRTALHRRQPCGVCVCVRLLDAVGRVSLCSGRLVYRKIVNWVCRQSCLSVLCVVLCRVVRVSM